MTAEELKTRYAATHFIKTKSYIEKPDLDLMRKEFIPDDDTPTFPEIIIGKSKLYPLSITAFPGVLKRMTALEAGAWAITKCRQQKWEAELDNFQCCLANLEMDF